MYGDSGCGYGDGGCGYGDGGYGDGGCGLLNLLYSIVCHAP